MYTKDGTGTVITRVTVRKWWGGYPRNRKAKPRGITVRITENNRELKYPYQSVSGIISDTIFHPSKASKLALPDYSLILAQHDFMTLLDLESQCKLKATLVLYNRTKNNRITVKF